MVDIALVADMIQLAPSQGQGIIQPFGNPWAVLILHSHQVNARFVKLNMPTELIQFQREMPVNSYKSISHSMFWNDTPIIHH